MRASAHVPRRVLAQESAPFLHTEERTSLRTVDVKNAC